MPGAVLHNRESHNKKRHPEPTSGRFHSEIRKCI